jgi:hypothetical protein
MWCLEEGERPGAAGEAAKDLDEGAAREVVRDEEVERLHQPGAGARERDAGDSP